MVKYTGKIKNHLRKMKMKHKSFIKIIAAMLLAVMVTLSLASCAAGGPSVAKDANGEGWSYTKDGQTLVVTSIAAYEGTATPWKAVASSVKKVIVGNGITAIPDYAFYNMTALETVEFQGGVTSIGKLSFAFTPALKEITLPETVTAIGYGAFEASGLVAVKLPASVTTISERTFVYCDDLTEVVGAGVTAIGKDAFAYCKSFKSLGVADIAAAANTADIFGEGTPAPTVTVASNDTYSVTVNYVYAEGGEASESKIELHAKDETYSITSPVIEGYTADKTVVTGTVGTAAVVETVTYTKNPEETEAPVETESAPVEEPKEEKLDFWTVFALIATVVILIGVAVAVILYVRHDKKKNSAKGGKKSKK